MHSSKVSPLLSGCISAQTPTNSSSPAFTQHFWPPGVICSWFLQPQLHTLTSTCLRRNWDFQPGFPWSSGVIPCDTVWESLLGSNNRTMNRTGSINSEMELFAQQLERKQEQCSTLSWDNLCFLSLRLLQSQEGDFKFEWLKANRKGVNVPPAAFLLLASPVKTRHQSWNDPPGPQFLML